VREHVLSKISEGTEGPAGERPAPIAQDLNALRPDAAPLEGVGARMATPSQREQQIRFSLSELGAHNGHHTFETVCRHFAQQRIASNILPATGPVSAGGDQGRDVETFHSVLREELGPHGQFLALVSDGLYVFTCTIQQEDVDKKILADVKTILGDGRRPAAIYAFCTGNLPVAKRHKLEKYIAKQFEGRFEIVDREALAAQIAQPDLYWIGEQYLELPAGLAPPPADPDQPLPEWYVADRDRWRLRGDPQGTLADILDLKDGLRHATRWADARPDLPFWLALARRLAADDVALEVRQRARYEIAYAAAQALADLRPVDDLIRGFYTDLLAAEAIDTSRVDDASTMLLFVTTSLYGRQTEITPEELRQWNDELRRRLRDALEAEDRPTRRALLLELLGHLALQRDPLKLPVSSEPLPHVDVLEILEPDGTMPKVVVDPRAWPAMVDIDETMQAWGELAVALESTPLFPVERFATRVSVTTSLLIDQPGYRDFIDAVDRAVGRSSGAAAVAAAARDRGLALRKAGRVRDALHELHTAKVEWWKGDTLRGSLLSMLLIAACYRELLLPQAAQHHALAVAYAALGSRDDSVLDLVPAGYLMASEYDYLAGAWCSAMELVDLGLVSQRMLVDLDVDEAAAHQESRAIATIGFTLRLARQLAPKFVPFVEQIAKKHGVYDGIDQIDKSIPYGDREVLLARIDEQLLGRPLNDAGPTRVIRFSALGTEWTITSSNRLVEARAAERLAAAVQVALVELAEEDLCIVPTAIRVRVEVRERDDDPNDVLRWKPSNDGRDWLVRLTPYEEGEALDPDAISLELLTVFSQILMDASFLPTDAYMEGVENAFRRGLGYKLGAVRPHDELGVPRETYGRTPRALLFPPADPVDFTPRPHQELHWRQDDGPTYDRAAALERITERYNRIPNMIPKALERLRRDRTFLGIVKELRSRGWQDWHILQALVNDALNHRLHAEGLGTAGTHDATHERMNELMDSGDIDESAGDLLEPTLKDLEFQGDIQLAVILKGWDLELNQPTPDIPGLERFLARRYHYWDDDVAHEDFFPIDELPAPEETLDDNRTAGTNA
jgi:hypothetical protein